MLGMVRLILPGQKNPGPGGVVPRSGRDGGSWGADPQNRDVRETGEN